MVREHCSEHASQWATVESIAAKIGCTARTLQNWMNKADVDAGLKAGVPTEMAERMRALERKVRELRQANEILKKASACIAQGSGRSGIASSDA